MPNDTATLRVVLDRWNELPPGPEREHLTRALHAALRALPEREARALITDIYRVFREEEQEEPRSVEGHANSSASGPVSSPG